LQSALSNGIIMTTNTMAASDSVSSKTNELAITPRDILFACPSCGKNLVVDEAAKGMIVHCPQCKTAVIVPPKPAPAGPPPVIEPKSISAGEKKPAAEGDDLRGRLVTITSKLRELQTQRTEINNRLASRMNDINRDLVMMARLETSQQQVISELNQLVSQIGTYATGTASAAHTRVNLRS
jgi:hypothetical protein